jgi:hypothetical protein
MQRWKQWMKHQFIKLKIWSLEACEYGTTNGQFKLEYRRAISDAILVIHYQ